MRSTILIVLLVLLIVGALPTWGWHSYGGTPSEILGALLVVILILALFGRI